MLRRILIAYFPRPPIIDYLSMAFEKKGVETYGYFSDTNSWFDKYVIHFLNKTAHNLRIIPKDRDLFKDHPLSHLQYRSNRLLEKVKEVSPDLVLIVRGWRFTEDALGEIRKNSMLFGWWIESEERVQEPLKELSLYDHYFFMNSHCLDKARETGYKGVSLLHHSVSTQAFHPVDGAKEYDWCFVGRWTPKRMTFVERAMRVSENGAIYGPEWLKKNPFNLSLRRLVKGNYISGEGLVSLYGATKVALNITNWGGEERSGMNMRVLEVPACKVLLLTDGSMDIKNVVTPGEHLIVYEGLDDFEDKLAHYIKNKTEREAIALAGYKHVTMNYTYDDVADEIIRAYKEDSKRRR